MLYCYVEPNDTVLILTQEAVWVSNNIAGTFHSKVGIVSIGFGHISTTLDPNWEGPLLISLNNPTKKRLKLVIGEEKPEGNKYKSFITLIFYKMISKTSRQQDNLPSRIEILKNLTNGLEYEKKYKELLEVIDKIRNFESIQVKIGQSPLSERKKKIGEFKDKYKRFANEILNNNIETALDISKEISDTNKNKYCFFVVCFGIVFILILLLAYNSYKNNNSNLLSLLAIITAVYIAISSVAENLVRKKYL